MYYNIVNIIVIALIRSLLPAFMFMLMYIGIIAALKIAIVLMRWRRFTWSNAKFFISFNNIQYEKLLVKKVKVVKTAKNGFAIVTQKIDAMIIKMRFQFVSSQLAQQNPKRSITFEFGVYPNMHLLKQKRMYCRKEN